MGCRSCGGNPRDPRVAYQVVDAAGVCVAVSETGACRTFPDAQSAFRSVAQFEPGWRIRKVFI